MEEFTEDEKGRYLSLFADIKKIYIVAVHKEENKINKVKFIFPDEPNKFYIKPIEFIIELLYDNSESVFVKDNNKEIKVSVAKTNPPYLRTDRNENLNDNLSFLDEF